nr:hypothetical protein CFP56_07356 [Quercus suber]
MHIFAFLDADTEDQPSGITIYADGENKEEQEDGEIVEAGYPEPRRKMSVPFPGVNGPIPENANERLWADGSSSSDLSRNRVHHRLGHYSEPVSRGHHREQSRFRDFIDEGPPGCEPQERINVIVAVTCEHDFPDRYKRERICTKFRWVFVEFRWCLLCSL